MWRSTVKNSRPDKDVLREEYEDSLFKLLMDDFAEKEGQRLTEENERLENDKDFVLPDGIEARGEKKISGVFAARRQKESWQRVRRLLGGVAAIILVCGIVFATLFTTVSAFREAVYKMLLNDETVNTDIDFQESNVASGLEKTIDVPAGAYLPAWMPEGYVLISFEKHEFRTIATFGNDYGNRIYYYELKNELVLGVDTEEGDSTEKINFNGYEGLMVIKDSTISITWFDSKRNILARIKTLDIDKKTVIKIAESVIKY